MRFAFVPLGVLRPLEKPLEPLVQDGLLRQPPESEAVPRAFEGRLLGRWDYRSSVKKSRAEAFSDGVFAVAATILVFNLIDPRVDRDLGTALLAAWPSYAAYVISFLTIVVIWVN